jgi:hypothetical protein
MPSTQLTVEINWPVHYTKGTASNGQLQKKNNFLIVSDASQSTFSIFPSQYYFTLDNIKILII